MRRKAAGRDAAVGKYMLWNEESIGGMSGGMEGWSDGMVLLFDELKRCWGLSGKAFAEFEDSRIGRDRADRCARRRRKRRSATRMPLVW